MKLFVIKSENILRVRAKEVSDCDYIKETSLEFCRKQKLKEAMMESVGLLQSCSFDEISTVINDALKLGSDNNFGYDYLVDFEERFKPSLESQLLLAGQRLIRSPVEDSARAN